MRLEHAIDVPAPVERVWPLLLDLEQVAPCLPGGEVTGKIDENTYAVGVRVKLGPVQMMYRGELAITSADQAERVVVMTAAAKEQRGQGSAQATITTSLTGEGDQTQAVTVTELQLTGRAAQMGRSIVEDVSNRLVGEFAQCLSSRFTEPEPSTGDGAGEQAPGDSVPPASRPISGFSLMMTMLRERLRRLFGRGRRRR